MYHQGVSVIMPINPIAPQGADALPFRRFQIHDGVEYGAVFEITKFFYRPLYHFRTGEVIDEIKLLVLKSSERDSVWLGSFVYEKGIGGRRVVDKEHIDFIFECGIPEIPEGVQFIEMDDMVVAQKTIKFEKYPPFKVKTYHWNTFRRLVKILQCPYITATQKPSARRHENDPI